MGFLARQAQAECLAGRVKAHLVDTQPEPQPSKAQSSECRAANSLFFRLLVSRRNSARRLLGAWSALSAETRWSRAARIEARKALAVSALNLTELSTFSTNAKSLFSLRSYLQAWAPYSECKQTLSCSVAPGFNCLLMFQTQGGLCKAGEEVEAGSRGHR